MRTEMKWIAAGLTAAVYVAGCESPGNNAVAEKDLRVGQHQVVRLLAPIIQHFGNGDTYLDTGEKCVMIRGSKLALRAGRVIYENKNAIGTECPDGAQIDLTPSEVTKQNNEYQLFVKRREEVINQVRTMATVSGKAIKASGNWEDLVNATPVRQQFNNGFEYLSYGDHCLAEGSVQEIGRLTTGEAVMQIVNNDQFGTECPTGVMYLSATH